MELCPDFQRASTPAYIPALHGEQMNLVNISTVTKEPLAIIRQTAIVLKDLRGAHLQTYLVIAK